MPDARPTASTRSPTVAVDLRALVPEAAGIGVYTRSLLGRLTAGHGGGLRYLGVAHRPPQALGDLAARLPVEVQSAPLGVLWQQWVLPRRLAAGDVDLLFSPLQTLPVLPLRPCPVPAVTTVHDLTILLYPETHRTKIRWSQLPFLERSLARARRIVVDSRSTADDLRRQFAGHAAKTRVIPLGVETRFSPAGAEEVERIRRDLDAPQGYLLYVGTAEPRKNLHLLIDAWESLALDAERFPPLLLAGGEGWHSRRLHRRIRKLRPLGLRHLGRVDEAELVRLYRGALAFTYPSLYEGFGLPPLEAMACGVPVVTSDVSSLPEVVGDAALTVNPRDGRALVDALRRVVTDRSLAAELAERGRHRSRRFTWERTAELTAEVLREALAEPAGRTSAARSG